MKRSISRANSLAAIAGLGALPLLGRPARADDALRMAAVPFDVTAAPYYADAMGFFKKAGANVSLMAFSTNGSVIAAAVAGGSVDIGTSNLVSLATGHMHNVPFTIVAPAGMFSASAPTTVLMVPQSSPLRTAKDLEGKTIAVNALKTISQFAPQAWIDKNGGNSSAVKFIETNVSDMLAGLAAGRLDAAVVTEPFITTASKTSRLFANCFEAIAPSFLISAYFTTVEFARAHADAIRRFQAAILESSKWGNANHAKSAEILAKAAKLDESNIRSTVRSVYAERLDPAQIQPVIDVTAKYGGGTAFPAEELIFR